jgi:hypothetical protein
MNKQDIARLIIDVYNAGKEDGHNQGYQLGYDNGYEKGFDRGFTAGQEDGMAQVAGIDEEEDGQDDSKKKPDLADPEYINGYIDGFNCDDTGAYTMWATEAYRIGWAKGYDDNANDRPYALPSIQPAKWPYDHGWYDGRGGDEPDEDMKHDRVYMWGYRNGYAVRSGG